MRIDHDKVKANVPYFVYDSMNANPDYCVYTDCIFEEAEHINSAYIIFDNEIEANQYARDHFYD